MISEFMDKPALENETTTIKKMRNFYNSCMSTGKLSVIVVKIRLHCQTARCERPLQTVMAIACC